MENLKEQKPDAEVVQAVDVELNEEQLDVVAGGIRGIMGGGPRGGCIPTFPNPKKFPDVFLPKSPDIDESI